MNLPKAWDAKLGAGSFFAFKKPIQEVCPVTDRDSYNPYVCDGEPSKRIPTYSTSVGASLTSTLRWLARLTTAAAAVATDLIHGRH